MLLFLSLVGIIMSLILLFFKGPNYRSSFYLGSFFFVVSLYGLVQYILLYSKSVFLTSIAEIHFSTLFYLPGPILYWYVRGVVADDSKLKWKDIWHLLPSLIFLIAALPYYFTPYATKLEIAKAIVADPGFIGSHNHTILAEIFSNGVIFASRPLFLLLYTLISDIIFLRYLKAKDKGTAIRSTSFMNTWLFLFLGFQTLLVSAYSVIMVHTFYGEPSNLFYTVNYLQILAAIGLIGLLASPFFFPEILYGLPRYPASFLKKLPDEVPLDPVSPLTVNGRFSLDAAYVEYISQRIQVVIAEFSPYCQTDFSVPSFAFSLGIPAHHLSLYLNTVLQQSFSDFKNFHRVGYAKQLIQEGKAEEMTLEAIGLASGFSNRITFFRAFKKVEGIAPSEFLAKMKQDSALA